MRGVPTKCTVEFAEALKKRGLNVDLEHKHIDISITDARMYIEIDELYHYTDANQITTDFKRDHFSDGEDFDTFRVPSDILGEHLDKIADAVAKVAKDRLKND